MIDKAIKLKRKVDLCSVEILDKSTTQQVNNYDESEDVSDTLLQRTISSTIPEQQFDLEKLREEICEEIREEIHKIRSNLYKRYKKETGHEPSEAVINMSAKPQISDFKPITFEAKSDPELIIKSVLEHFSY
ncbi:hypothetical protein GLOIN_2v1867340 [Rhizophagus irregularis DAOM 181602=DAOM 197198]|uniref:Uncharacterized protein n=1 Tax=Rhizophagus irregularis (strain DAOM 181602 / DAOM 197198 / MUCL 43194) TaxID=747089 RepID=A0A2P4QY79_RHIID|nr:hypothetical protein GLOIN_2v1867340 [Rhizophagus irregularis DAOM 181602=DAOM 197198]POG82614.1 hypothetical protein GLOIN_2v1867340 [Rhizophagus irregularis DAOM 181602=DAOM 197198]|eukprot:XP_025189480.1 hypothetical protein GLOIN_2v1867340 [Rhizophagus irregularis DAOM 181602=DAOM 197198]